MSNSTAPAAAVADFETVLAGTLGSLLIAVLLMSTLYGVTLMQTLDYYRSFPDDRITLRLFVAVLAILDTASTALLMHTSWVFLIRGWGNIAVLQHLPVTDVVNVQVTAVIAFAVQSYFVARLWTLSRGNIYLVGILIMFSLASLVSSVIYGVHQAEIDNIDLLDSIQSIEDISLAFAVATDLLVTMCLTFYFRRSRTAFSSTNNILDLLAKYTVGTGLLSSACAVCNMITFRASPTTEVYYIFFVLLPKLYVNNCLATLNVRKRLRTNDQAASTDDSHPLSRLTWNRNASGHASSTLGSRGGADTYIIPTTESGLANGAKAAGITTATLTHDV